MRLSSEVTEKDVEQAVQLVKDATLHSATDPATGLVDMSMLSTGISSGMVMRIRELSVVIEQVIVANESKYRKAASASSLL